MAAEGARRATEAAKETRTRNSFQVVIVFINNNFVEGDFELLLGDIDGRNHILVEASDGNRNLSPKMSNTGSLRINRTR